MVLKLLAGLAPMTHLASRMTQTSRAFCLAGLICLTSTLHAQDRLLTQVVQNVNATADATVDVTLPPAPKLATFTLSGAVTGTSPFFLSVTAVSSEQSSFSGAVNPATHKYQITLPAGTYRLSVAFLEPPSTLANYRDPAPVEVSADMVRDITVPALVKRQVSGVISGIDPKFQLRFLFFYDQAAASTAVLPINAMIGADGRYAVTLQDGSYSVSAILSRGAPSQTSAVPVQALTLVLGSVTVRGADTQADFTVPPTVNLSGVVQMADSSPIPAMSAIGAFEGNPLLLTNITSPQGFSFSSAGINSALGSYELVLATGHKYTVVASMPVLPRQASQSSGDLGVFLSSDTQFDTDTTRDFTIPAIPGTVSISGKVTDSSGAPVADASVDAATAEVSNISPGGFSRGTKTNADGNYRLVVLNGTNYTLTITPSVVTTPPF